jgi:molybdate transport system ATP-binding protein
VRAFLIFSMTLPAILHFIKQSQLWAIVGSSDSGHSSLINSIRGNHIENVSLKHHFKNLSNTTDFYYQQRFNSSDSEDSQTVSEYLATNANDAGKYWNIATVTKTLHLENLLDEQLIKLSNGETKRVLIATALIKNPAVLTFDQSLTGLDVNTRKEFSDILQSIHRSGTLVIMATDPFDIPAAITHVAVMKNDEIIFHDTKENYQPSNFSFHHEINIDTNAIRKLVKTESEGSYSIIVNMEKVTVEYGGKKILDDINWRVLQGERWSLTGPNGAGKSTLLSLINGDNPQAYANDITLFDRKRGSGESIWDIKKRTGFVSPELYQYFPTDSSCLHVIESGFYDTVGLFRPTDPIKEEICLTWMKMMQTQQYANKMFSMVPASVQRLCLLARALVKNPPLLILDEPTQGLDTSQQQFFTHLIDEICRVSNVTVIYVSHYEHHIPKAVTKRIKLENGRKV